MIVGKQSSEMMTERFNRWLWNDVVNKCTQDFSGSIGEDPAVNGRWQYGCMAAGQSPSVRACCSL